MKKTALLTIGVGIIGFVIPFIAFAITPTRNLILNLAPRDAILKLADKIDTNRLNDEAKIKELQTTVDSQKAQIDEQNQKIDTVKTNTNIAIAKSATCTINIATQCNGNIWKDPALFSKALNDVKTDPNGDKKTSIRSAQEMTDHFNRCQEALKCE